MNNKRKVSSKKSFKSSKKSIIMLFFILVIFIFLISALAINILVSNNIIKNSNLSASVMSSFCKISMVENKDDKVKLKIECGKNVKMAILDGSVIENNDGESIDCYKYIDKYKNVINYEWVTNSNISSGIKEYQIDK